MPKNKVKDKKIEKLLQWLFLTTRKIISDGIKKGKLQPEKETYLKWKLDKFKYTDTGIESSATGKYIDKDVWYRTIPEIQDLVKETSDHKNCLQELKKIFVKNKNISGNLQALVGEFARLCLDKPNIKDSEINYTIKNFLKALNNESLKYGAEAELEGIILHPKLIKINDKVILKRVERKDLEKEVPIIRSFMVQPRHAGDYTAILIIEILTRQANRLQEEIEKAITILRLFNVGSVKYKSYNMYSDSILDFLARGTLGSGGKEVAFEKYIVNQKDIQVLKGFWNKINTKIPQEFFSYDKSKIDYRTIAYNRYSDSLMYNGTSERRIANSIMGLEALFINENMELSYKLRTRIGRLLGLSGHNPHKTREVIKDAYTVRSSFAHGSQLDSRTRIKLEKKYGDIKSLLLLALNYLRVLACL